MDRQLPIFSFFGWPLFVKGSSVAKILELYGSARCQIKDMDIVFTQVPHNLVLFKWFRLNEIWQYLASFQTSFQWQNYHSKNFFENCLNWRPIILETWNQCPTVANALICIRTKKHICVLIHWWDIKELVMAPVCKWQKTSYMSISWAVPASSVLALV